MGEEDPAPVLTVGGPGQVAEQAPAGRAGLGPPAWRFHLGLVVPVVVLLWSSSTPVGGFWLLDVACALGLLAAAAAWAAWSLLWASARWRRRSTGSWRWLVVAPACGLAAYAVLAVDLPLRARWAVALPALDRIVESSPPAARNELVEIEAPTRVGTFRVSEANRVGDNVFVYVEPVVPFLQGGPFLLDAGFAHLPDGPLPGLYPGGEFADQVVYEHLGGDWYTFQTAW